MEIHMEMESARKNENSILVSDGEKRFNMGCFMQNGIDRSKPLFIMQLSGWVFHPLFLSQFLHYAGLESSLFEIGNPTNPFRG